MRSLYVPLSVLILLLALSLQAGARVDRLSTQWVDALDRADTLAQSGRWDLARSLLLDTAGSWQAEQRLLRAIADHGALESIWSNLAGALTACEEEDPVEFRILLSQSRQQLKALATAQALSIENVL